MGSGAGWFCDKIVIRESTATDGQLIYFPCGQWLDRGKSDGLIERTLLPQQPPAPVQETPEHPPAPVQEPPQQLPTPVQEPPKLVEEQPKTKPSTCNNLAFWLLND